MRGVGAVNLCVGWELSACAWGGSCQLVHGVGAVSVCVGWELSACAWGGSCQRVRGVGAVNLCMRVHSLQLEPRKNMLETLLRDNLEQRREELKKVRTTWGRCSEGEWLSEGSGLS